MIVSVQRPVIQNKQTIQNNLKQRTSINATNLNNDSFVSRKTNDNISFGRFLRFFKKAPITPVKGVAEKVFSPEVQRLMQKDQSGGTPVHYILHNYSIDKVEIFIKNLQNNLDDFPKIITIRTNSRENCTKDPIAGILKSPLDIMLDRAKSSTSKEEVERWDSLAASTIDSLRDNVKLNELIFPFNDNNSLLANPLKEAIIGKNINNINVKFTKTIYSIKQIMSKKPDEYLTMLKYTKNEFDDSAIKTAFINGNKCFIDSLTRPLVNDGKKLKTVFDSAVSECDNFDLAIKMSKYFGTKIGYYTQVRNAIYNTFKADKDYIGWNRLNDKNKSYITTAVEKIVQDPRIIKKDKTDLIAILPEHTEIIQDEYLTLLKLSDSPAA
jgi:hypothetical protein